MSQLYANSRNMQYAAKLMTQSKPYYFQHVAKRPLSPVLHAHDFYELYIMLRGGLRQIVNEVEYTQAEGDVVLIYPWENHVVIDHDLDTELYCLSILTSEMERMLDAYDVRERLRNMENRLIQLDSRALKDMDMMFRHMLLPSVLMREDYYRSAVGTIIQTFLKSRLHASNDWMANVLELMNTPENIAEGVPALLRISHLSHAQLCRTIKKQLNMTPQQYVKLLRMNYAFDRIQSTDDSCMDVAFEVGYSSLSHFSTTFKEHFGMTPAELRRKAHLFEL